MAKLTKNAPYFSRSSSSNEPRSSRIHWHQGHELYYLLSGTTKYLIGERPFFLQAGNMIFIPQGVLHSTDSENCLNTERLLISFKDSIIPDNYKPFLEELAADNIIYIPEKEQPKINAIFEKIEKEYEADESFKQELIDVYILELITVISRVRKKDVKLELSPQDAALYMISKYIRKNYHKDISLQSLSEHFSISKSYLSRRFKTVLGIGVNDYITYIRILHAENLLKTTNYPITQIAQSCGYNDSNYFATVFKRAKGTTPYKFKKDYLESQKTERES